MTNEIRNKQNEREKNKFVSESSQHKWGLWIGILALFILPIELLLRILG
ncbi:hypothetical protein BOCO_0367 [Bombiscardovia coagulans]|uniref:Uncharacterized protein n=1 Tax=Bombiscardovia coagulans TaxID=686666 RepID=A0A261ESK5_9BIFI|nr:hypothetical protein BOCO_0367 [Bombiscardovia coagulans]